MPETINIKEHNLPQFNENYINREAVAQGLPSTPIVPDVSLTSPNTQGLTFSDVWNQSIKQGTPKISSIPLSSFSDSPRYSRGTRPGEDWEEIYAQNQPWTSKMVNGVGKGLALTGTTFLQTTAGLVNGVFQWAKDGKPSSFYNNEFTKALDDFNKDLEDRLPNFYTHAERDARWYSPAKLLSANFIFDGIVKNLGFAAGAAASGLGFAAALRAIPLTARLFSTGRLAETLAATEKAALAGNAARGYGELKALSDSFLGSYNALNRGQRVLVAGLATTGEAGIEAFHNLNEFRDRKIQEYRDENFGQDPTGKDLDNINSLADSVGNSSVLLNMTLLSATNYIQFPKILGSSYTVEKGISNSAIREIGTITKEGVKYVAKPSTILGSRVLGKANRFRTYLFSTSEAFEEGAQFAITKGTEDYYNKKYNGESADFMESLSEGIKETLTTDEGMENVLLGGFSGAIMLARGKYIKNRERDVNTQAALSDSKISGQAGINSFELSDFQKDTADAVTRGIAIQRDREQRIEEGDVAGSKDSEMDYIINYLTPRIKYGRYDLVKSEIQDYRKLASTDEGFAQLQEEGKALEGDTKERYLARLDNFERVAEDVKSLYQSLTLRYGGEVITDEEGNPILSPENRPIRKYSSEVIDKMIYAATKINDYDVRIPAITISLSEKGIDVSQILTDIFDNGKPNREAVDETLKQINKLDVYSDIKDDLKSNLIDIIDLSLKRKAFIQEYDEIKNKPLNYTTDKDFAPGEYSDLPVSVKQKVKEEGDLRAKTVEKQVEIGKQYSLKEPILKEGNNLTLAPKLTVLSQTLAGEFQVRLPNGKISFLTPTEFKNYNLTEEDNTSQELADIMDKAIDDVIKSPQFKDVKDIYDEIKGEFNKLDFINNMDNPKLTSAVSKEFNIQSKELIERREKEQQLAERLLKNQEQLDKQQAEIEKVAGTVATPDSNNIPWEPEKRKEASILFTSGTTESEDTNDPTQSLPHIKRSREFLNNISSHPKRGSIRAILVTAEQSEKLGLKGITQLSFGVDQNMSFKDIPYDVLSPELGFVAQVFVIQEKGKTYFVDKDGNKLSQVGKQVDLDKVIFQTMPTTLLHYESGGNKFRDHQEEEAKKYAKAYTEYRKNLFSQDGSNPEIFNFVISRGIPIENELPDGTKERNHVGGILVDEDKISSDQGLIVIPTTGFITYNGESLKFPNGIPVLKHGSVLQHLNNKKFNEKEASVIFKVMDVLAKDLMTQVEKGGALRINREYANFLEDVLYWKSKGKETTSPNQISLDTKTMRINLGDKSYPITTLYEHEEEIVNQLQGAFNAINNTTLSKRFNKKFTEFVDEDLNTREWDNYQTYLLSSKYPDGKPRNVEDTPLVTTVAAPTESIPYSFKQKYATLEGMDLKIPITKEEAPKEEAPTAQPSEQKIDKYIIGKPNGYELSGNRIVMFTPTLENGEVEVIVHSNDVTQAIAANEKTMSDAVIPKVKELQGTDFDASLEDEEYVFYYLGTAIASDLQNKLNTQKSTEEAPVEEKGDVVQEDIIEESSEEEKPYNPDNTSGPSEEFRTVGSTNVERISDEEIEIFKQWHAENVPNIPYEILENVITINSNEKAWGVFEKGIAKFVRGGERATEYHEIFEGIYKGMLTLDQQQALLDEFKSNKGQFTDRATRKKIFYAEATDKEAKERIADDFADFRKGKLPARSLGENIRRFFKAIIDFFKSFSQKSKLKNSLFKAINEGGFKEHTLNPSVINEAAEYRAIPGLTEQQTHEFIQDMTARAAGVLYREGEKGLLFKPEAITSKEMFSKIEEMYINEGKRQELGDDGWNTLKERTLQSLRTLGITFSEEDIVSINSEDKNQRDYAPHPFSTDWKKTSSGAIKFSLATLLETVNTNQQNKLTLELPKALISKTKGYKLYNFSRAFATVLDKLSNTSSISNAVDKLFDLAKYDGNYVRLLQRVGVNMNGEVKFDQFNNEDWRYFIQFMQTFTKQKPEALVQYRSGGEIYTAPVNLFSVIKETQSGWTENIKALSKDNNSLITFNKRTKTFVVNTVKMKALPLRSAQNKIDLLAELGVIFPLDVYNKLKTEKIGNVRSSDQDRFNDAVSAIYNYLGSNNDIMSVRAKVLGINGPLSTLAELYVKVTNPNQENTHFGIDGERRNNYSENNYPSVFENEFNESETIDELLDKRPELNDVFSKNSQILKKGGIFFDKNGKRIRKLKVEYIQGTKNVIDGRYISIDRMSLGDRFAQEINQNLNGRYYILMPADGSTEWMLNLGNQIDFSEFESGKAWNKIYSIFKGYLMDDVALALDGVNRNYLRNIKGREKDLRFLNDVLYDRNLKEIKSLIDKDAALSDIEDYINTNIADINEAIKEYISDNVKETKELLIKDKQILEYGEGVFDYVYLDDVFSKAENLNKTSLSETTINNILTFANVNFIINNIEFHKVLFGDPYQFATKADGTLDETKRIKSFLSPRRTTFDHPDLNTFLNQQMNNIEGVDLVPGEPGYHEFKSYTDTITLQDNTVVGSLSNLVKAYETTNETDAFSWLMDNTYREIKIKNGQWGEDAEAFHQWQMAYTRQKFKSRGYTYTSDKLEKHDVKLLEKPVPKYQLEVLKPIVSGQKNNKLQSDLVLDKFSQMPIYFSMVEGTNLEKIYIKMFNQGIGYAVFESGRKVGIEQTHSLYNQDGSFNTESFTNSIEVPWKSYGIQVETVSEGEKFQTRGSQLTKLSSMDLFDNGVAITEEAQREYDRNTRILNEMHQNAYNELLNRLGIIEENGEFKLEDKTVISQTLMYEMLRREVSDNTKDAIQLDENNEFRIPFEAAPSYTQIRNIIYSLIDKAIISPKMNGAPHVQVPVTLFEKNTESRGLAIKNKDGKWEKITKQQYDALSEGEQKKVALTDDTLKFYLNEDGKRYCEIMVPHWFKNQFGNMSDEEILKYLNKTSEGRSILTGIGFRIPTQAQSSTEVFKVKGFLPQYMGYTVVVPSEITTKAGSDFDIDKLNMYLKSVYVDKDGKVKLVKYKGSEQATKEFYTKEFDERTSVQIEKIRKNSDFRVELFSVLDALESTEKILTGEQELFYNAYFDVINEIINQADDANLVPSEYMQKQIASLADKEAKITDERMVKELRENFVRDMYKKSLENEYYDSLEKLITLPENFNRLISPVSDAGLKKVANKLSKLRGYDESKIKNRIVNRNYMTKLRNSFLMGKKWVGIGAVNITNLSLKQKSQVYINPAKINALPENDKKWLKDGNVILKHNTTIVNGEPRVSLSGTKVKGGKQYISDRYSGYITSFVDVANDDYITRVIQSDNLIGTLMFLENIGAGEQGIMFLNQPIIDEYVKYLDGIGSRSLFNSKHTLHIKSLFPTNKKLIESVGIDLNNLEQNINKYYNSKLTEAQNAEQHNILDEFLKYAKMAEFNFKFTQSTNYDTSSFRSAETLTKKQWSTDRNEEDNIISSVKNILDSTFIGKQASYLDKFVEAMGEVFKLDKREFKIITDSVLRPYAENPYLGNDKYEKVANKIKMAFLDYIIQTKTGVNREIKPLLVDGELGIRLEHAKKKYPEFQILHNLEIVSGDRQDGAKSIKLKVNSKDAYDQNLYTGYMRELRDFAPTHQLYKDLITTSILQGTYQTAISIKNIIPIEDYGKIVAPVIEQLTNDGSLDNFLKGFFQRNHFTDPEIMPQVNPKFFVMNEGLPIAEQTTTFGDFYADIFKYHSYLFPPIDALNLKSTDRAILLLSEQYNSFDIKNDYVKIPRVITDRKTGESIDMKTGLTITKMSYVKMKQQGDPSLFDIYGYKKVKYPDGSPLIIEKNDKVGPEHVYKLINLYGDGIRVSEYYDKMNPSVIDNGTIKTQEIKDEFIIEIYGGQVKSKPIQNEAEVITIQEETIEEAPEIPTQETTEITKSIENISLIQPLNDRIDIKYPKTINDFNTLKLMELSKIPHDKIIINTEKDNLNYDEFIEEKYGSLAGDYVNVTNSEISESEANFIKNNFDFMNKYLNEYLNSIEGESLQSYAKKLLDNSDKEYIDKNQTSLLNEDDFWKDEENNCDIPF